MLISFILKMLNKLEMIKFQQGIKSPLDDSLQFDDRFNSISVCLRKEGEESPLAAACFHPFFFIRKQNMKSKEVRAKQQFRPGREAAKPFYVFMVNPNKLGHILNACL